MEGGGGERGRSMAAEGEAFTSRAAATGLIALGSAVRLFYKITVQHVQKESLTHY